MLTPSRPSKRKRPTTPDSVQSTPSTVLDTPQSSPQEIRTPSTIILTPGGVNIASGQESLMRRHEAYTQMLDNKQKYTLKLLNERLFDKDGNIKYDIRTDQQKLFYLVPATEEEVKQANKGEIRLYNKNGEPSQSDNLFNDINREMSLTGTLSSGISGNTSKDDLSSFGSMSKYGGKKRKSRKRTSHKKTNKKKINRKKHTKKGKKKSKKHTRKRGGVRPPTPDPHATPVMNI